jgi:hypothetical protein
VSDHDPFLLNTAITRLIDPDQPLLEADALMLISFMSGRKTSYADVSLTQGNKSSPPTIGHTDEAGEVEISEEPKDKEAKHWGPEIARVGDYKCTNVPTQDRSSIIHITHFWDASATPYNEDDRNKIFVFCYSSDRTQFSIGEHALGKVKLNLELLIYSPIIILSFLVFFLSNAIKGSFPSLHIASQHTVYYKGAKKGTQQNAGFYLWNES